MVLRLLHYADLESAYNDPERIGRFVGRIDQLRDEETIVCGSGDNTGPSVLSMLTSGKQAMDYYGAVEPDLETFGNHDFDHGIDRLLELVETSPQTWVCANAFHEETRFAASHGAVPWTIIETDQHNVGFFGITHPELPALNPNAKQVLITNPILTARYCVNNIQSSGVDYIVALSHTGNESELAQAIDVDVVLGGHEHTRMIDYIGGTLVCRPGANGRYLLEVSFDGKPSATHHHIEDAPLNRGIFDSLRCRIDTTSLNDVVGKIEEPIYCDMLACKKGESKIGNLITDAWRWKTGADVAINSGGGFRRCPPLQGEITEFDLISITPYDHDLLTMRVEGNTLMDVLEQLSLEGVSTNLPDWYFGHVSGASIVWNDNNSELVSTEIRGKPINPQETYQLTTNEFFVKSDELFPAVGLEDVAENDGPQNEAVIEYVSEIGLDPEPMGRIRRPELGSDAVPKRDWPNSPK